MAHYLYRPFNSITGKWITTDMTHYVVTQGVISDTTLENQLGVRPWDSTGPWLPVSQAVFSANYTKVTGDDPHPNLTPTAMPQLQSPNGTNWVLTVDDSGSSRWIPYDDWITMTGGGA